MMLLLNLKCLTRYIALDSLCCTGTLSVKVAFEVIGPRIHTAEEKIAEQKQNLSKLKQRVKSLKN